MFTPEAWGKAGFKGEIKAMDWATLTSRRASREPVDKGGWNMFHTWWIGADVIDPMAIAFSGDPDKGWFGWPSDEELEEARQAFPLAKTAEEKRSEEHTSELQSLMRISYAVFCLKKKKSKYHKL